MRYQINRCAYRFLICLLASLGLARPAAAQCDSAEVVGNPTLSCDNCGAGLITAHHELHV